jgi:hypothetical protein
MKNLITALNAAGREADNVIADSDNPAKNTKYASTHKVINSLRPLLNKHGLMIHPIPGVFTGTAIQNADRQGVAFMEVSGEQAMTFLVTHESGESMTFTASMPVNISNKGLTSSDRSMVVFTILTRKCWLGLLGVVEVDSEEKTLSSINEAQSADEATFKEAISAMDAAGSYEQALAVFSTAKASGNLSKESLALLVKKGAEIKAKLNGGAA